jgi:DNA-binding transcriptional regulator YhcF (GntR family)
MDTDSDASRQVRAATKDDLQPSERIAADLRGAIDSGILSPGDPIPIEKSLADRYGVASSTAHRAVAVGCRGTVTASRETVACVGGGSAAPIASVTELTPAHRKS